MCKFVPPFDISAVKNIQKVSANLITENAVTEEKSMEKESKNGILSFTYKKGGKRLSTFKSL